MICADYLYCDVFIIMVNAERNRNAIYFPDMCGLLCSLCGVSNGQLLLSRATHFGDLTSEILVIPTRLPTFCNPSDVQFGFRRIL